MKNETSARKKINQPMTENGKEETHQSTTAEASTEAAKQPANRQPAT